MAEPLCEKGSCDFLKEGRIIMFALTGMFKSGAQLIGKLLVQCGFSTGSHHKRPLQDSIPDLLKTPFDNQTVTYINHAILKRAGGSWNIIPSSQEIYNAGRTYAHCIEQYAESFTGTIVKDSLLCLTADLWEKWYTKLQAIIFCIRNPLSVAMSLKRIANVPIEKGLELWYLYNIYFINKNLHKPVIIVDYDNIAKNGEFELLNLFQDLQIDVSDETIKKILRSIRPEKNLSKNIPRYLLKKIPENTKKLYELLLSQTYNSRLIYT